ncbi:hypothetical protein NSERUTF1_5991 [Nocardia seriolae]|nr:hypothetical protein NSERUTF1_5991 [Nocardia seriolae]
MPTLARTHVQYDTVDEFGHIGDHPPSGLVVDVSGLRVENSKAGQGIHNPDPLES